MAFLRRSLRKAFSKELKHLLIKHGSEIVVGLLMGLVTEIFAEAAADANKHKGKKGKKKDRK